jgi:hypothetical protein
MQLGFSSPHFKRICKLSSYCDFVLHSIDKCPYWYLTELLWAEMFMCNNRKH